MTNAQLGRSIRFSQEAIDLFSAASHDRNPLHLSEAYAHRTPYGARVAFGVLGGLACLGRLDDRPDQTLSHLTLEFMNPIFIDQDYMINLANPSPDQAIVGLRDGRRSILKATARFRSGERAPSTFGAAHAARQESLDWQDADLFPGQSLSGQYAPDEDRLQRTMKWAGLEGRSVDAFHVVVLMACSYLIGMALPGRRALFSRLSLEFADVAPRDMPLTYIARVTAFDRRFDLLKIAVQFSAGAQSAASGELRAFVRRELYPPRPAGVEAHLARSEDLKGKVALVIGASRGLGAALAQALALQGCTVVANFLHSEAEAERLRNSLHDAPGCVLLRRGDGGDVRWCEAMRREIERDYGRLDFLVCNACPPIVPLWIEPEAVVRIREYVDKSLALVSAPLAVFLDVLAAQSGWAIVVSSSVTQSAPPADWPHYVSAKHAVEGLTRAAAQEYGAVKFLIARPPALLTDLTNTPLASQSALAPEIAAAKIVARLKEDAAPGCVEILEDFLP